MKDFHYARSRKITRSRNTYKLPQELLDPQVPHSFSQEQNTEARKLDRGRNLQLLTIQIWNNLWSTLDYKQNSLINPTHRIDEKLKAQVWVREN